MEQRRFGGSDGFCFSCRQNDVIRSMSGFPGSFGILMDSGHQCSKMGDAAMVKWQQQGNGWKSLGGDYQQQGTDTHTVLALVLAVSCEDLAILAGNDRPSHGTA